MISVIGVRLQGAGKVYYFDPGGYDLRDGDGVVVETDKGNEFGVVVQGINEVSRDALAQPLKQIVRVATESDKRLAQQNQQRERDALRVCEEKIAKHELDMKLVNVEYAFNGSKITFYFTADGRVDFRELVKDLAGVFKTRIELRQIGVRDEAKLIGGLGACGRIVCCKSFLDDFHPVSIKMAKEQSLSLSPNKISGICGRLMCCLKYEQDCYEATRKLMPKVGREVMTPDGRGSVVSNHIVAERVKVRFVLEDRSIELRDYPLSDISRIEAPKAGGARASRAEGQAPEARQNEEDAAGRQDADAAGTAGEDSELM